MELYTLDLWETVTECGFKEIICGFIEVGFNYGTGANLEGNLKHYFVLVLKLIFFSVLPP